MPRQPLAMSHPCPPLTAALKVRDIRYDVAGRRYHGTVTLFEPRGLRLVRVSAAGDPAWGYARAQRALGDAGLRALATTGACPETAKAAGRPGRATGPD